MVWLPLGLCLGLSRAPAPDQEPRSRLLRSRFDTPLTGTPPRACGAMAQEDALGHPGTRAVQPLRCLPAYTRWIRWGTLFRRFRARSRKHSRKIRWPSCAGQ